MLVSFRICALFSLIAIFTLLAHSDERPPSEDPKREISDDEFSNQTLTSPESFILGDSRLRNLIRTEIKRIDEFVMLSATQVEELQKAAKLESKETLDRIEIARMRYVAIPLSREEFLRARIEIGVLQAQRLSPLQDADGAFQKTLKKLVTDEQAEGYARYRQEARRSRLEQVWKSWEARRPNGLTLSRETRDQLNQLLLEEAPPLGSRGIFDEQIILLLLSEREERVKGIMSDDEWAAFSTAVVGARKIERTLRDFKLWPISTKPAE